MPLNPSPRCGAEALREDSVIVDKIARINFCFHGFLCQNCGFFFEPLVLESKSISSSKRRD